MYTHHIYTLYIIHPTSPHLTSLLLPSPPFFINHHTIIFPSSFDHLPTIFARAKNPRIQDRTQDKTKCKYKYTKKKKRKNFEE